MMWLGNIRFGPAGFPDATKGRLVRVFKILNDAGLDALEYAAVYGLRLGEPRAREIGQLARTHGISMSMHEAYYISLASKSAEVRERSKDRLVKALKFAPLMRVKRIVFHAGGYSGLGSEEAYQVIRDALREVWEKAGDLGRGAILSPEVAGKLGAFGSVEELEQLCSEIDGTLPTIDWAHLYARTQGEINDKDRYLGVLAQFENALGKQFTDNMHFHVSGINYTQRGEKSHRPLGGKWGPDILPLVEIVSDTGYNPTFISETPSPIRGALYVKALYEELEKMKG
ncbi:MAG: TIM barrel protein [Candidatus Thorarchaeota archaeon]|jgi:deoxyribonuclease-4